MWDGTATMLPESGRPKSDRFLDPIERSSEIMFGLIMALTFTSSVSVASSTPNDVNTLLASALSCNVAWGFVDGAMYVLENVIARKRKRNFLHDIAGASPREARQVLSAQMPDGLEYQLSNDEIDGLVVGFRALVPPPQSLHPNREELAGAAWIFLLVFTSTFPVTLPFLLIGDVSWALRTSNAIAVVLLFLVGTGLGRYMELEVPWIAGVIVALFGTILVAITIALGG
jgi:hypothetical protein